MVDILYSSRKFISHIINHTKTIHQRVKKYQNKITKYSFPVKTNFGSICKLGKLVTFNLLSRIHIIILILSTYTTEHCILFCALM